MTGWLQVSLINDGWHTLKVGGSAHTDAELGPSSSWGGATGWPGGRAEAVRRITSFLAPRRTEGPE